MARRSVPRSRAIGTHVNAKLNRRFDILALRTGEQTQSESPIPSIAQPSIAQPSIAAPAVAELQREQECGNPVSRQRPGERTASVSVRVSGESRNRLDLRDASQARGEVPAQGRLRVWVAHDCR